MTDATKTIDQLVEEFLFSSDYYTAPAEVPPAQKPHYVAVVSEILRKRGQDAKIVERAAILLGHVGGDEAEALLWDLLERIEPTVRGAALTGLRQIGSSTRIDVIIQCLDDPVPAVRKETLKTLAAIGDEACLSPVADYGERETVDYLCDLARQANREIAQRVRPRDSGEES